MNTQKQLQIAAFFIAVIVVSIPYCVSDAQAASVNIQGIAGADGIDGFMRRSDTITIEAQASISDTEDVQFDNLRLYVNQGATYAYFDSCDKLGDSASFSCILTRNLRGWSGVHLLEVKLYSDANKYDEDASPAATDSMQVGVDTGHAVVNSISVLPERTTEMIAEVSYSAQDFGISDDSMDGCSGIDRIEFYKGDYTGELIKTEYPAETTCIFEGSFTYEATEEGQITICAKAFDRMGQSEIRSVCADFYVDNVGPQPDLATLEIVDALTNDPLVYIGGQSMMTDIIIAFPDDDIVIESVKADMSQIAGPTMDIAVPTDYAYDARRGHVFTWTNIAMRDIQSCTMTFDAEDTVGNSASTEVPCNIQVDLKGPVVKSLTTPSSRAGTYFIGTVGTIKAGITEEGIGLNNSDIELDLTNINGMSRVNPDNCTHISGTNWECFWTVAPTAADGKYSVIIYKESKDDLGNIMDDKFATTLGVDRHSPEINQEVGFTVVPGVTGVPYENITIAGDNLEFRIEVSDVYSARADLSGIGAGTNVSPDSCETINQTTYCTWRASVQASGPYDANIEFTFEDFAGNTNSITKTVPVAGLLTEPSPDYWGYAITCSPYCINERRLCIDRDLATFINFPGTCELALIKKNQNAEIQSFSMEAYPQNCYLVDDNGSVTDFVTDIVMFRNTPPFDNNPRVYMSVAFAPRDYNDTDTFEFGCSYEIYTKVGDEYTLNPEIENVSVTVEFYNDPYGTLPDNYEDKLDDIEGWLEVFGEWFGYLVGIIDYAEAICQLNAVWTNIVAVWTILTAGLSPISVATEGTYAYPAAQAAYMSSCQGESLAKEKTQKAKVGFMDQLCGFVNCKFGKNVTDGLNDESEATPPNYEWYTELGGTSESWLTNYTQEWGNLGFDMKKSIYLSVVGLCLPGIIDGIDRFRQVECSYGVCLLQDVPNGIPVTLCDAFKSRGMCEVYVGEIFYAFPFTNLWNGIASMVQQAMTDWVSLGTVLLEFMLGCNRVCDGAHNTAQKWQYALCSGIGTTKMLLQAIEDISNIEETMDMFEGVTNSSCSTYWELKEEYEEGGGEIG